MGMFDFLSGGMTGQPGAYSQFQQPNDYSQILGGGQASPATQGLDFGKIGDWATQMAQKTQWAQNPSSANFQGALAGGNATQMQGPDWQKLIGNMGPTQATMGTQATQSPLQNHARQVQLGQVQQGNAGYIGGNQRLGLLGMIR